MADRHKRVELTYATVTSWVSVETHRETAETAKLLQGDEFPEIVNCRVDPAATLRQQNFPVIRSHGVLMSIPDELRFEEGEVLEEQRSKVWIFTKMQKVLHMQCVDTILRVVVDKLVEDE